MSVLVLVVDDEPDVEALFRQQFRRDLRAQRFVMDFAISAADALGRIADTIEQSLILILSDINMPGMTGLEMLPKVKELRPDVPVIMVTAYGDADTKRKAIESGADGLLTKPIDFTLLREEIDTRLVQEPVKSDATGLDQSLPLSFCLSMIFGQTLRVCPEGKPVSTHRVVARGHAFPDYAHGRAPGPEIGSPLLT